MAAMVRTRRNLEVRSPTRNNGTDHMKSPRYEDPSARIWSTYLSEAEKYDEALAHSWKSDMDAILIFVCWVLIIPRLGANVWL